VEWVNGLTPGALDLRVLPSGSAPRVPLSLSPGDTLTEALKNGSYAALLVATLWLVNTRKRLAIIMWCVALAASANAVFGLAEYYLAAASPAQQSDPDAGLWVNGSYANRNHFAGLIIMAVPVTLGLFLALMPAIPAGSALRDRLLHWLDCVFGPGGGAIFIGITLLAGLLMSGSRGGAMALLGGGVLVLGLMSLRSRDRARLRSFLPWGGLMLVVVFLWTQSGLVGERAATLGLASNRLQLYDTASALLSVSPWLGIGGGAFEWVFPAVKDAVFGQSSFGYIYTHVHSDPLELLIEYGLAGTLVLAASLIVLIGIGLGALRTRREPLAHGAAVASVGGTTALLVHSCVDFNFHIPANAAIWFVLLGIGVIAADRQLFARRRGVARAVHSEARDPSSQVSS
jgi:O-antigen ligase